MTPPQPAPTQGEPCVHQWKSVRMGGNPADECSEERVCVCELCGLERGDVESELPVHPPGSAQELLLRIQSYLGNGGLFNPEMMEHDKARDLMMDLRTFVSEHS